MDDLAASTFLRLIGRPGAGTLARVYRSRAPSGPWRADIGGYLAFVAVVIIAS
jgi:hypothetical protein